MSFLRLAGLDKHYVLLIVETYAHMQNFGHSRCWHLCFPFSAPDSTQTSGFATFFPRNAASILSAEPYPPACVYLCKLT